MVHFRNELVRCPYISLVEQSYSQAALQLFSPIPRLLSSFSVLFPGCSPAFQSYSQATFQHFSPIPRPLSSFSVLFPGHSPAFSCTAKAEKDPGNEATVKYVG